MPKAIDYTGQTFGRLTAIRYTGRYHRYGKHAKRIWLFRCECGNQKEVLVEKVVKGWTKSCGCLKTTRTSLEVLQHRCFKEGYSDGDLEEKEFITLSELPCWWCGALPSNLKVGRYKKDITWLVNGLDRLDNNKPHNRDNVVPCCWDCNEMRKNRTVQHFMNKIETIYLNRIIKKYAT